MDSLIAERIVTSSLLGNAVRPLSEFCLKALYLTCDHREDGPARVPDIVAGFMEEWQVRFVGGLLASADGRTQIRSAIDAEVDVRTWGKLN